MGFNEVALEVAAKARLDFQLEAGQVSEAVNVTASNQATLNRESTSVTGVINQKMITDLPLPGRNALDLILTQGGLLGDNFGGQRIGALNINTRWHRRHGPPNKLWDQLYRLQQHRSC